MSTPGPSEKPQKRRQLPAPKGTRDFYPEDLLRRRYIEKAWRDTSIRHGFEEIEGPTFETAELYKVKSGQGILGEMFGVFSGKAEEDLKQLRETGEAPFALRPEFTPTLARMYAARAGQLAKPTKWFTAGPYFRAEKPQRGRLREFHQWNVDFVDGTESVTTGSPWVVGDFEILTCNVGSFKSLGLRPEDVQLRLSSRSNAREALLANGVPEQGIDDALQIVDRIERIRPEELSARLAQIGAQATSFDLFRAATPRTCEAEKNNPRFKGLDLIAALAIDHGIGDWCRIDIGIVRGLAYYTGMVFEAIAEGERAVCGGGRYDNLIELFGGPPTPAVGFGMGDVVLGNLLQDKGLMPEGPALMEALSVPAAGLRPDVFVISNGSEEADPQVRPLVARLRRGQESDAWLAREGRKPWDKDRYTARAMHARHSYKATKNIGKLLEDARKSSARFAAIIENAEECSLKNLDTGEQRERLKLAELAAAVGA